MNRLVQGVSSQYIEAANRLRPKGTRRRIVAYVESYQDVAFWRLLLDEFESDSLTFSIMLPSDGRLMRGKKSALSGCLDAHSLGKSMIACVDSDYDYLMQGATSSSREFLDNKYVIQTYTYAIENYQCYSSSLNQVCVQCTLNDSRPVDIEAFMEVYSNIIFPVFAWNIYFYRIGRHSDFTMQELSKVFAIDSISVREPDKSLQRLETRVSAKIAWLERKYPEMKPGVEKLKSELRGLGVEPGETYLYVHGHSLFERVILRLLEPILMFLKREREMEISRQAIHLQQKQNELSAYRHAQVELTEALRENTHYRESRQYQRMRDDVARLIAEL